MSECLMAQRGGKYTRGRTITDDNVTPVHFLFEQIWSANTSNSSSCSIDTDDQGNLYVSRRNGGIIKLSETDGSRIWVNTNINYNDSDAGNYYNMKNRAVVDESGDIYVVCDATFPYRNTPAKCIRKLSGIDGREIWDIDFPYDVYDMGVDNSGDIILLGDTVAKLSNVDKTIIWNSGPIDAYNLAIGKNNIYATTNEGIKILSDVDGHIISTINKYRGQRFLLSDNADNLYISSSGDSYGCVDKISSINNKKYGTYVAMNTNNTGASYGFTIYNDYIYMVTLASPPDLAGKINIVNKCYRKNVYTIVS